MRNCQFYAELPVFKAAAVCMEIYFFFLEYNGSSLIFVFQFYQCYLRKYLLKKLGKVNQSDFQFHWFKWPTVSLRFFQIHEYDEKMMKRSSKPNKLLTKQKRCFHLNQSVHLAHKKCLESKCWNNIWKRSITLNELSDLNFSLITFTFQIALSFIVLCGVCVLSIWKQAMLTAVPMWCFFVFSL